MLPSSVVFNLIEPNCFIDFVQIVEEEEDDDDFVPRSPVPLPDVSTCRPILVQLGFSLSARAKKCNYFKEIMLHLGISYLFENRLISLSLSLPLFLSLSLSLSLGTS